MIPQNKTKNIIAKIVITSRIFVLSCIKNFIAFKTLSFIPLTTYVGKTRISQDFSRYGWSYLGWSRIEIEMSSEVSTRMTTFWPLLVVGIRRDRYSRITLMKKTSIKTNYRSMNKSLPLFWNMPFFILFTICLYWLHFQSKKKTKNSKSRSYQKVYVALSDPGYMKFQH